jgi:xyloglucan-specific endo-beta-1,4-glucanase
VRDDELRAVLRGAAAEHEPDLDRIRRAERRLTESRGSGMSRATLRGPAVRRSNHGLRAAVMSVPAVALVAAACVLAVNPGLITSWLSPDGAVPVLRPVADSPALPLDAAEPPATPAPGLIGEPALASPSDTPVAPSVAPDLTASSAPPSPSNSLPRSGSPVTLPPGVSIPDGWSVDPQDRCDSGASVVLAPYWVSNNQWNAATGSGVQCVRALTGAGTTVGWSTHWQWSGDPNTTKSYASVVLGWHWGWRVPGTGLPVRLDEDRRIPTRWDFGPSASTQGAFDASYDLWFHTVSNPQWNNTPDVEMRIVLYSSGLGPPTGTLLSRVTVDGATWDLYLANRKWPVYAFVRTTPTTSIDTDLRDFTDVLRQQPGVSPQLYLSSIETGANVLTGSGELVTSAFSAEIGPAGG